MRTTTLGRDADAEEVATQLRARLGPGAKVSVEGDGTLVVRRGSLHRCGVTLHPTPEGTAVEVRGDAGGVPLPLLAVVLRRVGDRGIAAAVVAALDGEGSNAGDLRTDRAARP
ncbi:MAG: hypothetical protein WBU92_04355 [Candidatus Dormiibacterota bacterium]